MRSPRRRVSLAATASVAAADGVNPPSVHYVVIPFANMIAALKAHQVSAISASALLFH